MLKTKELIEKGLSVHDSKVRAAQGSKAAQYSFSQVGGAPCGRSDGASEQYRIGIGNISGVDSSSGVRCSSECVVRTHCAYFSFFHATNHRDRLSVREVRCVERESISSQFGFTSVSFQLQRIIVCQCRVDLCQRAQSDWTHQHSVTDRHFPQSTCAPAADRDHVVSHLGSRNRIVSHIPADVGHRLILRACCFLSLARAGVLCHCSVMCTALHFLSIAAFC